MDNVYPMERDIADARASVQGDIYALDAKIREERALAEAKLRDQAAIVVGGAAALGLLLGLGGMKTIKMLLALGVPAAAIALLMRQRQM